MGCKAGLRHPLFLLTLLLCVFSWGCCPILAKLYKAGSHFSTHKTSAFWRSQNGECTFGFKYIAASEAYLLSLWFTKDLNQTPIWWPDLSKHSPKPLVTKGAVLRFTRETSLGLWAKNEKGDFVLVWSEVDSMGKCAFAQVTDTCNLVVLDLEGKVQLWQSFADARDSLMLPRYGNGSLEAKPLVIDKPYLLQSKASYHSYAPGRFRASSDYDQNLALYAALDQQYEYNSGIHLQTDYIYMYANMVVTANFRINEANGKTFINNGTNMAEINRLTLSEDGNLNIYSWEFNSWRKIWQMVDDKCKLASPCGPFAVCKGGMNEFLQCKCPFNSKLAMKASRKVTMPSAAKLQLKSSVKSSIKDSKQTCGSNLGFGAIDCSTRPVMTKENVTMLEVADIDYYHNDLRPFIPVVSMLECKDLCLQECKCIAASYNESEKLCALKGNPDTGILMSGYESNGTTLLLKVKPSHHRKTPLFTLDRTKSSRSFVRGVATLGAGVGIVVVIATIGCMSLMLKRKALLLFNSYEDAELDIERKNGRPKRYTYKEIVDATHKFCHLLGEGGFGKVYKGWMRAEMDWDGKADDGCNVHSQNQIAEPHEQVEREGEEKMEIHEDPSPEVVVAVKVLKGFGYEESDDSKDHQISSNQKHMDAGEKQFGAEVSTLGKIHHVNLVSLLGYCATRMHWGHHKGKRFLVYEYVENGSLDKYLTMPQILQKDYLPWHVRFSIALDIARGIAYLHHGCNPPILHCDIKPQNVLLDKNFCAKVSDFGLACTLKQQQSHLTVTCVRGTRGYLAPEWLSSGDVTSKLDVYSYGMLLLELVYTGELVENAGGLIVDRSTLFHWALQSISPGRETGVTSNDTLHPPPEADIPASNLEIAQENLNGDSASPESLRMDESSTPPIPRKSVDESIEVVEDHHVRISSTSESQEKLRLIKIGLWCVQFSPAMRPSMSIVVQLLQGTIPVDDPPNPTPHPRRIVSLPSFLSESTDCTACMSFSCQHCHAR